MSTNTRNQPDRVTATDSGRSFMAHPAGQFAVRCVDVINLGERVDTYQGTVKVLPKCALVFRSGKQNPDTGDALEVSVEFTVSMHENASLRKFLASWRGKPYTEKQAKAGVPLDKLVGQAALVSITQQTSQKGRTYAKIGAIMPLPENMPAPPDFMDYERAGFWADRKEEYAAEVRKLRGRSEEVPQGEYDDDPGPDGPFTEDDTDLPF